MDQFEKKVNRVIKRNQNACLKTYIDMKKDSQKNKLILEKIF